MIIVVVLMVLLGLGLTVWYDLREDLGFHFNRFERDTIINKRRLEEARNQFDTQYHQEKPHD